MEPMQSETVGALFTALSAMHGDQKDAEKNVVNSHYKNKYADLPAQFEVIRPALHKHGLCLTQTTYVDGNVLFLKTILGHKSGEWIRSDYPVCMFPARQQELGSALTYSRRYMSAAITLIASDAPDDDGNDAKTPVKVAPKATPKPVEPAPAPAAETVVPFTVEESDQARQDMLGDLIKITTRAELMAWAKKNKPIKARMTEEDQDMVTQGFNQIDAGLKG